MSDSELKVTDRRWWARGEGTPSPESEVPKLKPTYVEELEAKLAEKDAEIQQLLGKYRGASDEFDEARARVRKEVQKDVERSRRAVIVSFLDVLDNLDRALDAAEGREDDPFVQGVALVHQQFVMTLEGLGITREDPIGVPFDPSRHEAVTTIPAPPGIDQGTVVGLVRSGYLIGDEVLRPAMVAVAQG